MATPLSYRHSATTLLGLGSGLGLELGWGQGQGQGTLPPQRHHLVHAAAADGIHDPLITLETLLQ